jgi:glucose-1-phosphate cytidylyltransferase
LNKSFLKKKKISFNYNLDKKKCNITLIDTGLKSMTGRRLKLASQYIKDDNFFLTYGDGLANINLKKLLDLHLKKKNLLLFQQ